MNQEPETCTLGLVEVYDPIGTNGGQCLGCASKRTVEHPVAGERPLLASLLQEITGVRSRLLDTGGGTLAAYVRPRPRSGGANGPSPGDAASGTGCIALLSGATELD